jgi:hypothetical protein
MGSQFHYAEDEQVLVRRLFLQLGTPPIGCSLLNLPSYPRQVQRGGRVPWAPSIYAVAGIAGVSLLDACLAWEPSQRPRAQEVERHAYLCPELLGFQCGFVPLTAGSRAASEQELRTFAGERHRWTIIDGAMAHEVLTFLLDDPALSWAGLGINFDMEAASIKTEEHRKFIQAGALGRCASQTMCRLDLTGRFPLPRVAAFFRAFHRVNVATIAKMDSMLQSRVSGLGPLGSNCDHFLKTPVEEWLLTCGELCVHAPANADGSYWEEPRHQDGGASILHGGLTLAGRRRLRCEQGGDLGDVVVTCAPGSFYLGTLTGPWHQVHHEKPAPGEAWVPLGNKEEFSITVMCRCALFPQNRSRVKSTTPSPVEFFHVLADTLTEVLLELPWRLPSLHEVQEELRLSGGTSTGSGIEHGLWDCGLVLVDLVWLVLCLASGGPGI